jgi:hypothetical protein
MRKMSSCVIPDGTRIVAVPNKTCRRCGKAGFVRMERVIHGAQSIQTFYCGACDASWQIADSAGSEDLRGAVDSKTTERARREDPPLRPPRKQR